ncbi:hypothetical protein, partial [Silvimonas amylolytica]|uniref:hypothetical protein n=1 Tax=Silvimonas amylolytica TaxID=449663 RepID=UPI001E498271
MRFSKFFLRLVSAIQANWQVGESRLARPREIQKLLMNQSIELNIEKKNWYSARFPGDAVQKRHPSSSVEADQGRPVCARYIATIKNGKIDVGRGTSRNENGHPSPGGRLHLVELSGIEPLTSCMPCKRSP